MTFYLSAGPTPGDDDDIALPLSALSKSFCVWRVACALRFHGGGLSCRDRCVWTSAKNAETAGYSAHITEKVRLNLFGTQFRETHIQSAVWQEGRCTIVISIPKDSSDRSSPALCAPTHLTGPLGVRSTFPPHAYRLFYRRLLLRRGPCVGWSMGRGMRRRLRRYVVALFVRGRRLCAPLSNPRARHRAGARALDPTYCPRHEAAGLLPLGRKRRKIYIED